VCVVSGHEPENHFRETDGYISTKRCKKCHNMLLGGITFKFKNISPPGSSDKQIKEWEDYCDKKYESLRSYEK